MLRQFIKLMLKKRNLCFFIIIVIVFSIGCINQVYVSVDLPEEMNLNKKTTSSIDISYMSAYSTPQKVTIGLTTTNSRLGISLNESGPFQKNIKFTEEVGTNYQNKKSVYVNVTDASLPPGDYEIIVDIVGEKSKEGDWISKNMVVHLTP